MGRVARDPVSPPSGAGRERVSPSQAARPERGGSDDDLLAAIRQVIESSPFTGEGYRKVWARLRFQGLRTAARRVRRIMKAHGLPAPHRPAPRAAHPHDRTIVTGRVDEVWDEPSSRH